MCALVLRRSVPSRLNASQNSSNWRTFLLTSSRIISTPSLALNFTSSFHPPRTVSVNRSEYDSSRRDGKEAEESSQHTPGCRQSRSVSQPVYDFVQWIRATQSLPQKEVPKQSSGGKHESGNKQNPEDEDDSRKNAMIRLAIWMAAAYGTVTLLSYLIPNAGSAQGFRFISWNEFVYQMLQAGEVEQVVVKPEINLAVVYLQDGAIVRGRRAEHRVYHMMLQDVGKFESKLREAEAEMGIRPGFEIPVIIERNNDTAWIILLSLVAVSFMVLYMFRNGAIKKTGFGDMFSGLTKAKFTLRDPLTAKDQGVKFADVAGLQEAKQEVMELVSYLRDQKRYRALGAKIPKGVLMLGPPGCGKTLLAKAIATEASVPFLSMAGTEFVEMIGGLGAARVRDLFKEARRRAPCIIYIDEIDAIGRKRSGGSGGGAAGGGSGEEEQTLNQLLVEMDGMGSSEGVMVLASTNRPDILDRALQRPGRFDRHITIDSPTLQDRKEIFEVYLKKIKLKGDVGKFAGHFAKLTPGMTGADIANVVNEAAIHAATALKPIVDRTDFEAALERVVAGQEKKTNMLSGQEKEIVAYHEAGHALVGWLLQHTDALLRVSIKPRTSHALGFAQYTPNEQKLYSSEDLLERMAMALGGRAAEAVIFNKISTGAQDDLRKVTKMAYAQVRAYGMSPAVGLIAFPEVDSDDRAGFLTKPYSKRLAHIMDTEARNLVAHAYKTAEKVLVDNRDKLVKLAEMLIKKEQLSYEDVELLIGSPPYGPKSKITPSDWDSFQEEDYTDVKSPRDMPSSESPPARSDSS
ncbi:hypothetical protein RvY_16876 [Ramazzottius varieornatus]|uniref:AAA+ ATPase domain-containing protein n=1 Tax=Ramazzottius varieornatus TaxID=947166 RepID=A0A1D1W016_RAMVA|nr:hypothetical protein RvY_16876 [Ramazzottius varieornatus]